MEPTDSNPTSHNGQQAPISPAAAVPATLPQTLPPAAPETAPETSTEIAQVLDAHGYDPADYDWVPVLKQRRADGWSPQKQRTFITVLADTGSVTRAAAAVCMSRQACYDLRRSPGGENFDRAWDAALSWSSKGLIDIAFDRAINGVEEPVFDKGGQRIACRYRYNDKLLMFLIRAHAPQQYRHAHRDGRFADEALPPPAEHVGDILRLLEPEMPAQPERLMAPDDLNDALHCANILPGQLPRWRRDPDPHAVPIKDWREKEVDRLLDEARAENAKLVPPRDEEGWDDEG
jgi:hypothetical protein